MKTIKLPYKDKLGTYATAIIKLNDDLQPENLETLPSDLQDDIINGNYDNTFCDFDDALLI